VTQQQLNLGILAHVDAGKTTLTERLLYEAGVIDEIGSVDAGTTQTDSLALERRRGITIRSAVASFAIDDVHVNLIDTPGHPDFIAEVERVLSVLDGAVLVISAVESVQPQTRILMRALERLHIPTLLFVNKIDRAGADTARVLQAIGDRLTPEIVAMGSADELGTRDAAVAVFGVDDPTFRTRLAESLAERDERILAAYVDDEPGLSGRRLRAVLAAQTARALVHPVFFGSAITGAGVRDLMRGIAELLPRAASDRDGGVRGTVFKIERGAAGEKVAYVRMFAGSIRTRDRVRVGVGSEDKVTAIAVFERGHAVQRSSVAAGAVAKLWGLAAVRVGDRIGDVAAINAEQQFAPPTFESVVAPCDPDDGAMLRVALAQLAEQDPLIAVRQDERGELSVSLYGEVQKEVIGATLASDFAIEVFFRETSPLYIERPLRSGEAVEALHAESNPYNATIGLRIEPAPDGSGIALRLPLDHSDVPLYVYKRFEHFAEAMDSYVRESLRVGLHGWRVTDCVVTMTRCSYSIADGPPSKRGPTSTAADFRKLTPLVLAQSLDRAGTVVCEPVLLARLEVPTRSLGGVTAALSRLGTSLESSSVGPELSTIEALLPALRVQELQRLLPELTGGEGVLESFFAGHQPIIGAQPTRIAPATVSRR
jgi:ribosomal protection tetracycline resistance protein